MYFRYFYISGAIGLILLFVAQSLDFVKKIAIEGGLLDGSAYPDLFRYCGTVLKQHD
ncbi:hypothetical protein HBP98_04825 [Listeria booriae]|nr:hypothetical protein [Listeria booriae]MBC2371330.1 hypothetical protein [Listeria booriae]